MLQELEQCAVGPVHVLEHEHERSLRGDRFEKAPPGGEGLGTLGRFRCLGDLGPDERSEPRLEPVPLRRLCDDALDGRLQLGRSLLRTVGLEDACLALDDLAKCPEGDALAVGEAASLPPDGRFRLLLEEGAELGEQARLADSRLARDRDQLHAGLSDGPCVCLP